tara:strand:- start:412 stop:621 length:210 start_codon:yes stop_codon:yes gene_type:complete
MPKLCNSLEGIKDSLAKSVQLTAQKKGIPPKETLLSHDIVLPDSIPNLWDAVDLVSHCAKSDEEGPERG